MADELRSRGIEKVDGILLDLGVSSYQLDNEEEVFPIGMILLWTCEWTEGRAVQPEILSTAMKNGNFIVLSAITAKINSPKI